MAPLISVWADGYSGKGGVARKESQFGSGVIRNPSALRMALIGRQKLYVYFESQQAIAASAAHRSYLSPDHKWVLAVEMDPEGGCLAAWFLSTEVRLASQWGLFPASAPMRRGRPTGTGCISRRTREAVSTSGASAFPMET